VSGQTLRLVPPPAEVSAVDARLAAAEETARVLWEWVQTLLAAALKAQAEARHWKRVARARAPVEQTASVDPLLGDGPERP